MCEDMDLSEKMQYSSNTSSILTAILVSIMSAFDVYIKSAADMADIFAM